MGKIKRVELSEEVIEFTKKETSAMGREQALEHIERMLAGEIDYSHNKRIKRCPQCRYWFEDSRANKRKCCSKSCKNRFDTAKRKGRRQQATADRQGLSVEQLGDKRAEGRFEEVTIGSSSKLDYFAHGGNSGNRKKVTREVDESGKGKPKTYVYYGQRKVDREPSEVTLTYCSPEKINEYFVEKYGTHRLKMERRRACGKY